MSTRDHKKHKKRKKSGHDSSSSLTKELQSVWDVLTANEPGLTDACSMEDDGTTRTANTKKKTKKKKRRKVSHPTPEPPTQQNAQFLGDVKKGKKHDVALPPAVSVGVHPFPTDFCDHFETPLVAYQHLRPVLQSVAVHLGKSEEDLRIYDPFYCSGTAASHLHALGFGTVIHTNTDFWAAVKEKRVPDYDILVTNPPFSGDHKPRLLQYCVDSGRPWAVLVPNYVTTKEYYKSVLAAPPAAPFYLVPRIQYEFEHPTGKGHETSPFASLWCVDMNNRASTAHVCERSERSLPGGVQCVRTPDELASRHLVRSGKRKNPRQRRRRRLVT